MIVFIMRQEDLSKVSNSDHFCMRVDVIILFEFMHTLLFVASTSLKTRIRHQFFLSSTILRWRLIQSTIVSINATHFPLNFSDL